MAHFTPHWASPVGGRVPIDNINHLGESPATTPPNIRRMGSYMNAQDRRKLSMAVRALEFSQAQPSTDPGYAAIVARLERDIDLAGQLIVEENDGHTGEDAGQASREAFRSTIARLLSHLAHVAATAGKTDPELAKKFPRIPQRSPNRVLIGKAESMLAAATVEKDLLVANGLGVTFLDDLAAAMAAYDKSTGTAHSGRISHVGARADLPVVVSECVALVRILDGLNRERFAGDPKLLAAWMSARNVAGPFRHAPGTPPEGKAA